MSIALDPTGYNTDKCAGSYLEAYQKHLMPLAGNEVRLLELGVLKGGSLLLWRDYFNKGIIVGLDINSVHVEDDTGRIRIYQGRQEDAALLDRIGREQAPGGFDIIIDDASHIAEFTKKSFQTLFHNHLKPGGIYIIEDWGTGYWDNFLDGAKFKTPRDCFSERIRGAIRKLFIFLSGTMLARSHFLARVFEHYRLIFVKKRYNSHMYGMVGFIKELIDECACDDITRRHAMEGSPGPKIKEMHILQGQVIIIKAGD